jgi:DNA polymerase-1
MKPRLYLVDAHAYLHRAYHALPPLNNSKGEPVGALYGFARMLLQLIRREKPDALAVCFDHPEPTFRHKAFEQYKATRKEIDPDLISQLGRASEMVCAMGLCTVELPGYEADDIMATLAVRAVKEGQEAVLVTGDKDALQLARPGIRIMRDVTNAVVFDPPQVEEKFGVTPAQVIDYLAIIGDTSDNVPGIKGVGPVGAVKLLKQFGTVEKAVAAAKKGDPSIKPATAAALVAAEKEVPLYKQLITLETDAPIKEKVADCKLVSPDEAKLRPVFEALEFTSLLRELVPTAESSAAGPAKPSPPAAPKAGGGLAVAERPAAVSVAVPAWKETPFAQLETDLVKAKSLILAAVRSDGNLVDGSKVHLAVGTADGKIAVLTQDEVLKNKKSLAALFSNKATKAVYGLKDFLVALEQVGLDEPEHAFDTLLAQFCLNPQRPKVEQFEANDWKGPLLWRAGKACGEKELRETLECEGVLALYDEVERPLVEVLRAMERQGVAVDAGYLTKLSAEFDHEIDRLQKELDTLAGFAFNVNSPKQLGELLYDKLGLPVLHKTAKGGRSTDEESLKSLAGLHAIPGKVLEFRELSKLKGTYIDGLLARLDPKDNRVHTTFDMTGAETGRLSSVNPNLQNIPVRSEPGQRIRRAFVAPKGAVLVSADYSQIDLRVLAHMSQDAVLLDSFRKNEDIHTRTASEVFHVPPERVDKEMRRRAKAVNFGIVYGQTAFGLSATLGIPQKEAALIIHNYLDRYPGIQRWVEKNLDEARATGVARTFLGRVRHLPELAAKNTALRQFGERAARNTPIQGGSADVIKVAMLKVSAALAAEKFKSKMLLQIHDELLFETPKSEVAAFSKWVKKAMETAVKLNVPIVVDVKAGPNWQDMEKIA